MYSIKQSNKMKDLEKRGFSPPENYFNNFADQLTPPPRKKKILFPYIAAAASVILFLFVGTLYFESVKNEQEPESISFEEEIMYDESIDFEEMILAFVEEDEIDYQLFEDLDDNVLEDYLLEGIEYEEL